MQQSNDEGRTDPKEQGRDTPNVGAYQVRETRGGDRYLTRVGSVFPSRDGIGSELVLHSLPVDGRVKLLTGEEREAEKQRGATQKKERPQERDR